MKRVPMLDRLRALPVLGTLIATFEEALKDGAKDSAASIAYFSLFSLFPLLLGLVAVASFAFEPVEVRVRIEDLLNQSLPGTADMVSGILDGVIRLRGTMGFVSLAALLWAASAAFGAVSRVINRAWGTETNRPFYVSKLRYLAMCAVVLVLFVLSVFVTAGVELVVGLNQPLLEAFGLSDAVARNGARLISFAFLFSMFGLLYKVMPRTQTRWREVWPGAFLAAVLVEIAQDLFVRYLDNVANFEAVYGSLSSVIVLLLWLYLSAWILILGAELIYVRRQAQPVD